MADVVERLTLSPLSTPTKAAEFLIKRPVAEVFASYTLLVAVIPVTVMVLVVMLAVVVG